MAEKKKTHLKYFPPGLEEAKKTVPAVDWQGGNGKSERN